MPTTTGCSYDFGSMRGSFYGEMNVFYDANEIYDAGTKAIKSSPFKYGTQLFEMNHLLETAKIQEGMQTRTFKFDKGRKHVIKERGKTRFITSDTMRVKSVNHLVCDNVLMPATDKYLIYDNGASRKGKGVSFHRQRFEYHLHQYYNRHQSNEGYILLIDFSGYYANIRHDKCLETLMAFLQTIPSCVMGGVCIALYGFIAVSGFKMLQKVNLNENRNLFVACVIFITGVGGMTVTFGAVEIRTVACALILGILTNVMLSGKKEGENDQAPLQK